MLRDLHEQLVGDRAVVGRLTDDMEGDDVAAGFADRCGQPAESTWSVRELDVHSPQCHGHQSSPALFPIRYRHMTGPDHASYVVHNITATDEWVAAAHEVCPYSKATRGNVEVQLKATV